MSSIRLPELTKSFHVDHTLLKDYVVLDRCGSQVSTKLKRSLCPGDLCQRIR